MGFVSTLLIGLLSLGAFAATSSTSVKVEGMTCASCARTIERNLKNFSEVESVKISISSEQVLLTFREGKSLAPEQIKQAIKDAGYSVVSIEDAVTQR